MLGRGLTRRSAVGDGLQPTRAVVAVDLVRQPGGQCLVNAFLDRQIRPRQKSHGNVVRIDAIDQTAYSGLRPPGHRSRCSHMFGGLAATMVVIVKTYVAT